MSERAKLITADHLISRLCELAIVGDHVRRVVIDAEIGNAIKVYVEMFGDDRLLQVALDASEIIIKEVQGNPEAQEAGKQAARSFLGELRSHGLLGAR